jgi:hypothetical protein
LRVAPSKFNFFSSLLLTFPGNVADGDPNTAADGPFFRPLGCADTETIRRAITGTIGQTICETVCGANG